MPKILLYITAKVIWNFLFWNTDYYENRAQVHVGKRSTEHLCKIWLEPIVEVEDKGDHSWGVGIFRAPRIVSAMDNA